jgi:hypothetical protein
MKQKLRPGFVRALIVAGLVGVIVLLAAFLSRGPYGFLDQFTSQRLEPSHPILPRVGLAPLASASRTEYAFVFSTSDGPAILDKLKKELTSSQGFTARDEMKSSPEMAWVADPRDQIWSFRTDQGESVVYAFGRFADTYRGTVQVEGSGQNYIPGYYNPACVVIITHRLTWWDKTLGAVRGLLHM